MNPVNLVPDKAPTAALVFQEYDHAVTHFREHPELVLIGELATLRPERQGVVAIAATYPDAVAAARARIVLERTRLEWRRHIWKKDKYNRWRRDSDGKPIRPHMRRGLLGQLLGLEYRPYKPAGERQQRERVKDYYTGV